MLKKSLRHAKPNALSKIYFGHFVSLEKKVFMLKVNVEKIPNEYGFLHSLGTELLNMLHSAYVYNWDEDGQVLHLHLNILD